MDAPEKLSIIDAMLSTEFMRQVINPSPLVKMFENEFDMRRAKERLQRLGLNPPDYPGEIEFEVRGLGQWLNTYPTEPEPLPLAPDYEI